MYTAQQVQGGWNVVDENKERVAGPYPSKESAQKLIDDLAFDRKWEEDRKDPAKRWQMEQGEYELNDDPLHGKFNV